LTVHHSKELPGVVVGIVCSAGHSETLQKFLRNVPSDCGAAFVVSQHNHAQKEDVSGFTGREVCQKLSMPVLEVSDGLRIQKNKIYMPPAGTHIFVKNRLLHLIKTDELEQTELGADLFLTSLSENFQDHVIGMLLNGTDDFEGMAGISAVKEAGGITIFHDEQPARYAAVNFSGLKNWSVDLFLSFEKLGQELADIVRHKEALVDFFDKESGLERIFHALKSKTGVNFTYYKKSLILRHVQRRMTINKYDAIEEYSNLLENASEEVDSLFKDILISLNSFFRSETMFNTLCEKVFPVIMEEKRRGDKIRIWIPGCSFGEQAYALAIALSMTLEKNVQDYNIKIFATDVNSSAVKSARLGIYPKHIASYLPKDILNTYFTLNDKGYKVNHEIRSMVFFSHQDLLNAPSFSNLDLVHFPNSLCSFQSEIQNRVLQLFHFALNPSGFLFADGSEADKQLGELFDPVEPNLFRSKQITYQYNLYFSDTEYLPRIQSEKGIEITQRGVSLADVVHKIVKTNYCPPGVIINDKGEILHIHGNVKQYLNFVEGHIGANVFSVARRGLPMNIRLGLRRAKQDGKPATIDVASFKDNKNTRLISIHVHPITLRNWETQLFLVLFHDITPQQGFRISPSIIDTDEGTSFTFCI
jgi:two-component system CheB/CheR fusion protein